MAVKCDGKAAARSPRHADVHTNGSDVCDTILWRIIFPFFPFSFSLLSFLTGCRMEAFVNSINNTRESEDTFKRNKKRGYNKFNIEKKKYI